MMWLTGWMHDVSEDPGSPLFLLGHPMKRKQAAPLQSASRAGAGGGQPGRTVPAPAFCRDRPTLSDAAGTPILQQS